jgi:Tol biopolymer transport system component
MYLFVLLLLLLVPATAQASFPGDNGEFVLSIDLEDQCQTGLDLVIVPSEGGMLEPLTDVCTGAEDGQGKLFRSPDAAPDGASILARSDVVASGFVEVAVDNSTISEVPAPEGVTAYNASPPSFAPDGERFAVEGDMYEGGFDTLPLWEVPLDGTEPRQIVGPPGCDTRRLCSTFENPRWSPDGRLIAVEVSTPRYKQRVKGALQPGIWLIRAADGKPVRRLTDRGQDVDWSPNGKQLVFATHYSRRESGGAAGGNLWVVKRKGGKARSLVHRENIAETEPVWSPDGRTVAWVALNFTAGDVGFDVFPSLWRVKASGGRPQKIQSLPEPYQEEGFYEAPELTWLPLP